MKSSDNRGILPTDLSKLLEGPTYGRLTKATSAMQRLIRGRVEAWNSGLNSERGPMVWGGVPLDGNKAAAPVDPEASALGRGVLDAYADGHVAEAEVPVRRVPLPPAAMPAGPRFLSGNFVNEAGSRPYKLFIPSGYRPGEPIPLVVMLHGCTQSPDDFAAGTRMNEAAEKRTILVVYPGQTRSANLQKCWNWFKESEQRRDMGEPSLIAGIAHDVIGHYAVDPRRIYVAGISAGGAAAAVMGETYPDLFAAVGVHSGLACGIAHNLSTAMTAMRGGHLPVFRSAVAASDMERQSVPTIVFHGDRDATVHPRNAEQVVAQSAGASALTMRTDDVRVEHGHDYSRTVGVDAAGEVVVEKWMVHGGGHAWSGGSPNGSYTDPQGPDATTEMLRFFLDHPRPTTAADV